MIGTVFAAALLAFAPPAAPPAPAAATPAAATPAAAPAPAEDPKVTALAKEWLHRAQTGEIDRSELGSQLNAKLTTDLVAQAKAQLGSLGDPTAFAYVTSRDLKVGTGYLYLVSFKDVKLDEFIEIDKDGKIDGLGFRPAQ